MTFHWSNSASEYLCVRVLRPKGSVSFSLCRLDGMDRGISDVPSALWVQRVLLPCLDQLSVKQA